MMTLLYKHREMLATIALASLAGLGLFDVAARTRASYFDWFIAESYADIIASSIQHGRYFPWFSYYFNGGSYILQDPQTPLYSPLVFWVWLLDSRWGLRANIAMWGMAGFLGMTLWLRSHVGLRAAHVAGLAWMWSLAFVWRIVVGNDMFVWIAAAPWLLLLIERLAKQPVLRNAALCALAGAMLIWGPSYHAVLFCLMPVTGIWWLVQLLRCFTAKGAGLAFSACSALAMLMALAMAAPRLAAWHAFPMERPVLYDGTMTLWHAMRALCDYTICSAYVLPRVGTDTPWGVWESSVALPFPAFLLALVGLLMIVRIRHIAHRALWLFACAAIVVGFLPACTPSVWRNLFSLLGGNVRVPERFLITAVFGMAVLTALGMYYIQHNHKKSARFLYWSSLLLMCCSLLCWRTQAGRNNLLDCSWAHDLPDSSILASISNGAPHVVFLPVFPPDPGTFEARPLMHGCLLATSPHFQLTGIQNWTSPYSVRTFNDFSAPRSAGLCSVEGGAIALKLDPTCFQLILPSNTIVHLRLNPSPLGDIVTCSPLDAVYAINASVGDYAVHNLSSGTITLRVAPRPPFGVIHIAIALLTFIACVTVLILPSIRGARRIVWSGRPAT